MSTIGQVDSGIATNYDTSKTKASSKANSYGNTIGDVKLSDKAAKYYEELKKKYSDKDFVLVSNDEVDGAEQKAAKFANANRTLVLIDAEKIEKMAEDEEYRKKYEDIIGNADTQLQQMKESLGSLVGDVKTFGIKVDDNGNTSFFAVVDKSLAAQKERIEKKAQQKEEDRKAQKAEEAKKAREKTQKTEKKEKTDQSETISATSVEELAKKLSDRYMERLSDKVQTEAEKNMGTTVDFRL